MNSDLPHCLTGAKSVSLHADTKIFEVGDRCEQFYYLLEGIIRVDLMTRAGKPLTLYRIHGGQTCILTTACLLSGDLYRAEATVETSARALVLSFAKFQYLIEHSAEFRTLVFSSFALRLSSMMAKIEEVTTIPVDRRLALRALELWVDQPTTIMITHDQLAADLGTAREVISRKLATWEERGWIKRARGSFTIIKKDQLERLANDHSSIG